MESLTTDIRRMPFIRVSKEDMLRHALENPFAVIHALGGLTLYEFVQCFWNEVSDAPFKSNWHIPYICGELEELAERVARREPKLADVIINIPPGTTKTMVCSVMFPVWCWTKWYWMKFITGSYSDDLSLESADKSRDIMRSDKFQMMYPNIGIQEDKNTKSNYRICQKERDKNGKVKRIVLGGGRYSTSVGATITGFHGDINIWDDLINPKQAMSEVLLKTVNDWVDQTASSRKTDKDVSVTVLIMQRLHQNDPTGHLLDKKDKKIKHLCLPGEILAYRDKVRPIELISKYVDGMLDPVRLSLSALKEMQADLGQYGYAGQVGQHPTPPGGGMFKVANFQIIQSIPSEIHQTHAMRYWDKAGTKDGGKRTAGVKLVKLSNNRFIIVDVIKGQWASEEREMVIRRTAEMDGRNCEVGIEQEPGSGGKESAEATVRNLTGFVVHKDLPHGDKVFRADPYSVQVNNGNIMLLQGDWNNDFIEEHRFFPFGTFKDQVDAASAGFNLMAGRRVAQMLT
jgi:predicted phage terminase large subunit-like protein